MPPPSEARGGLHAAAAPIVAVLAVVVHDGQVLLVRRRNEPDARLWGFPGGRVEWGETLADAAARELREETSLQSVPGRVLPALDAVEAGADGARSHFVLVPVLCAATTFAAAPATDVDAVRWVSLGELESGTVATSSGVLELARHALAAHGTP